MTALRASWNRLTYEDNNDSYVLLEAAIHVTTDNCLRSKPTLLHQGFDFRIAAAEAAVGFGRIDCVAD
jgi:hypothetical protein